MDEGKILFGTVGKPYKPPKPDFCGKSKERYGITGNIREAGYILADGTMLDFSGRHEAVGYEKGKPKPGQPDYLKNQRSTDHRDVKQLIPHTDEPFDKMIRFMRECKAIRVMAASDSLNIDFVKNITERQEHVLGNFEGRPAFVGIDDLNGRAVCSKEFDHLTMPKLRAMIEDCKSKIHPKGHIIVPNE